MTVEEFKKIPMRWQSHLALKSEHSTVYASKCRRFGVCFHTIKRKDGIFGRTYTHYMVDGKVYKSEKALAEGLKDVTL